MATLLEVLGDHKIEFTSAKEAIKIFEEKLNVVVKNGTYKSEIVKNKVVDVHEIQYFVPYDHLEKNYNRWNEIKILTNYKHCQAINIFKRVIKFDAGFKYSFWRNYVLKDLILKDQIQMSEFFENNWKETNDLFDRLTGILGGKTLIYFDDSRFQMEAEMYNQGSSIELIIDEMSKKWMPTNFEEIVQRKEEFNVKNGWYIKNITKH